MSNSTTRREFVRLAATATIAPLFICRDADAQNVADQSYMQNADNNSIVAEARKLSKALAGGKSDEGTMKKIVSIAHRQYDGATKKLRVVNPPYRYAAVLTPTELGNDHCILVDPVNESITVFSGVKTAADGKLEYDKTSIAGMWAKDIKLDDDGKQRIAAAAAHALNYAQDKLVATFEQRTKAAEAALGKK